MADVVRAVIEKNGKILLVKKDNTDWYNFPGGKIEEHESKEEALKREINEELGVYVKDSLYLGSSTFRTNNKRITSYLYKITIEGEPWARREIIELLWQPIDKIKKVRLGKSTVSLVYLLSHK